MKTKLSPLEKTLTVCMCVWIAIALYAVFQCSRLSAEVRWWKTNCNYMIHK